MKKYYIFFAILGVITLGATIAETISAKDPLNDERTVSDLRDISSKVDEYAGKNGQLPQNLSDLELDSAVAERAKKYDYKKVDDYETYELCATFKTDAQNDFGGGYSSYLDNSPEYHKKGHQCFEFHAYSYSYPTTDDNSSSSAEDSAHDTERKTDIKALHSHLEAYYAQNSIYPSLANLNDDSWVSTNLKGLDLEALKDPQGTDNNLATKPTSKVYAYEVTPSDCDNADNSDCTSYILTAKLESGGRYTKYSLEF